MLLILSHADIDSTDRYRGLEVIHIRQHRHISFPKYLLYVRDTATVAGPIFSIFHGVPRRSASVDDSSETKKFQIERLTRGRRKPKGLSVQPDIEARLSLARAVCGRVGPKTMKVIPENLIWFALQFIYYTLTDYTVVSLIEIVF
jgi:hypothetical protein